MIDFTNITKALSDENRLRILLALRGRELCVCQITAFLDLAPSTTSKHLAVLRQARLIDSRKHGKWVYYALQEADAAHGNPKVVAQAVAALEWVLNALADHPSILADEERMRHILQREGAGCAAGNARLPGMEDEDTEGVEMDNFHSLAIHSLENEDSDY